MVLTAESWVAPADPRLVDSGFVALAVAPVVCQAVISVVRNPL